VAEDQRVVVEDLPMNPTGVQPEPLRAGGPNVMATPGAEEPEEAAKPQAVEAVNQPKLLLTLAENITAPTSFLAT
tara:strand:- start:442 stop:666 length:225 start_codon:yes stop_codon:yes gene_type:complete